MATGGYGESPTGERQPMSADDYTEMMDVEYSVEEYFEPEEWLEMGRPEKMRFRSLRNHYEAMKAMGELF